MTPTNPPTERDLDRIAERIATDGIAAAEAELPAVVAAAERAGVPSAILAVLADPAQPSVARARAFGMTATHLSSRPRATASALPATHRAIRPHRPVRRVPTALSGALMVTRTR